MTFPISGARCVATLLHEMKRRGKDARFGVVSMCIGLSYSIHIKWCCLKNIWENENQNKFGEMGRKIQMGEICIKLWFPWEKPLFYDFQIFWLSKYRNDIYYLFIWFNVAGSGMGAAAVFERGDWVNGLCNAQPVKPNDYFSLDAL